jgi:hypothetical protein
MRYDEEIEKLTAKVAELEARLTAVEPEPAEEPQPYTSDYLETLTVDAIADLYKGGHIDASQLGAAIAAQTVIASQLETVGALQTKVDELQGRVDQLPPVAAAETKSSGDDKDAGDWTKAGDGTDYPTNGVAPTPSSPKAEEGVVEQGVVDEGSAS